MNLSGLLSLIDDVPSYQSLLQRLQTTDSLNRLIVLDAAKPYLLSCLHHHLNSPILVITSTPERAKWLYEELLVWRGNDATVALFPEPDALPYERLLSDSYTVQHRLSVLFNLNQEGNVPLIVTSAYASVRKVIPAIIFASSCYTLKKGAKINLEQTLSQWMELGYEMENSVEVPGTMSRRGGIIDIYPPNSELPARIDLFGDEVESIRLFNPASQRSVEFVTQITIIPAKESIIHANAIGDIRRLIDSSPLSAEARATIERELELLATRQWFEGMDFYASILNNGSFLDYIPGHSLIVLDQPDSIETAIAELQMQAHDLRQAQEEQGLLPRNYPVPYFTWAETLAKLDVFGRKLALEQWGDENESREISFSPVSSYSGLIPEFIEAIREMRKDKRRIIIVSQQAERLSELFEEHDIIATPASEVVHLPPLGSLTLVHGSLAEGWGINGTGGDIIFSDVEIFGFAKKRRSLTKRPARHESLLSELSYGDYVVHIDHGIARFSGLTKLNLDNGEHEYLVLEYAAGDKLYVPTDQIDRVNHYIGPGGYNPSLSRLGTQEWNRSKQKVKDATNILAKELLELYSTRDVLPGFKFSPDTVWQQELEASFPYMETPDQLEAVQDVKRDMEKTTPMDRLVCGDVGYGKTEVALRATFKAVMDGMQVAILVPTTVLAQQHFTTFRERLGAFPIKIDILSRFRSAKEQKQVIQGLADGNIDICIGTHRIFQKDVSFKNLGLVIVDEEQRFGVAHKEQLKQLRKEVDVLTLSATPIPRTLHMSLIGVRDMSTIDTPPEERLPIKSYVAPYNERLVREAILREIERNGQVFYVHNRVQSIDRVARTLKALVPEARIAIAHGQMPEETLESVMLNFAGSKTNVLVCTTIIESGLDLPNANTLIIDDADKLGLTQLYQLRGRIGRGVNRAYAYFLYNKGKQLTDAAQKRLKTIFEATELGSGFRIAMKDLEIRGAGNLLGPEQSGNMGAVGFQLYCRLLSEAVATLKSERKQKPVPESATTTVDLPLAAYIPEEYVSDLDTRLSLYLKLSRVHSLEQVSELGIELEDRFGSLPMEVSNLLYMIRIKLLGSGADIQDISSKDTNIVIKLRPNAVMDRELLRRSFGDKLRVGTTQLRIATDRVGKVWPRVLEEVLTLMAVEHQ
ncbi:MAG: transcription-repair coupling factor [Chloroflexota bacterium]|nr:transcription-repair coupling factor [Chloroflexota bacterium]